MGTSDAPKVHEKYLTIVFGEQSFEPGKQTTKTNNKQNMSVTNSLGVVIDL